MEVLRGGYVCIGGSFTDGKTSTFPCVLPRIRTCFWDPCICIVLYTRCTAGRQ